MFLLMAAINLLVPTFAAAQNSPVSFNQIGTNGGKGSDEPFEAGKTGGGGQTLTPFTYTFTDQLASMTAGVPAFHLGRTAGSGGNGGSSDCCNGGSGGTGGALTATTLVGNATLTTSQSNSPGLSVIFVLGSGGNGGDSGGCCKGGNGGEASTEAIGVPALTLNSYNAVTKTNIPWSIGTLGTSAAALEIINRAGNGGKGGTGASEGSSGGAGGVAGAISLGQSGVPAQAFSLNATTTGNQSPGISIQSSPIGGSVSGNGGKGGSNDTADGGNGGSGGTPQLLNVTLGATTISTSGDSSPSINVLSQGGTGGEGGEGKSFGDGGTGGAGGGGGQVQIELYDQIKLTTQGDTSHGVSALSVGGEGGESGDGGFASNPGKPGAGSASGTVTIDALSGVNGANLPTGTVTAFGDGAIGLNAQSIGGHGGNGVNSAGLVAFNVSGGSAGDGGAVTIGNALVVTTDGNGANAINGQSLGGGGGNGGNSFGVFYSGSGSGGAGGDGGTVDITNTAVASTGGFDSTVIYAQSVGGAGGTGGSAGALVAFGGRAGPGANGGAVTVTNSGSLNAGANATGTAPAALCPGCSSGILAHSVGGGGGKAGSTGGWFAIGGTGGGGGDGGSTTVNNAGSIKTRLANSSAIMAQSVGGGGGAGGAAVSAGFTLSASVGGSGGAGGSGGVVNITSVPTTTTGDLNIQTAGDTSHGIAAQSVGGGGGHGGFAVSTSVDVAPSLAVAVGGSGGQGGHGSNVTIDSQGAGSQSASLSTTGDHSYGIFGKSIGGGGGTGGAAIAGTLSVGSSGAGGIAVGVGGSGGIGGNAGQVDITSGGNVATSGLSSPGVVGMSIGGGGGGGGLSVAASVSVGSAGIDVGIGGKGGTAGDGGAVSVKQLTGTLTTKGDHAEAILAQSVGGGGGRGATSIAAGLSSSGGVNVSLGGGGGAGGAAATVTVEAASDISTGDAMAGTGDHSAAVVAQSLGGGGGHGGLSIGAAASASSAASVGVSIGGKGGKGGDAGGASIQSSGKITTAGGHAAGLMSQSIGGGGGNGGLSVAGSLSLGGSTAVNVSVGGSGGTAGASLNTLTGNIAALVDNNGSIATQGIFSSGIVSQSIGGGGGNGGLSVAGAITTPSSNTVQASVGGDGSGGGTAGFTVVCNGKDDQTEGTCGGTEDSGGVSTTGETSHGILAQSIGGGGGHSGISIAGSPAAETSIGIGVGGSGGAGGAGGALFVYSEGATSTQGDTSNGILAQSIGGSGGASFATISANGYATDSIDVTVGGSGGDAGNSGAVTIVANDTLSTAGSLSDGISALSAAGSGGHGGFAASATGIATAADIGVAVGGSGGGGGTAGQASVTWSGTKLETTGDQSVGIYAHSGGGSGGRGGTVINGQIGSVNDVTVSVGGKGGKGGTAGSATIISNGVVSTAGTLAPALSASSLGGNGGRGGVTIATTGVSQRNVDVSLGGNGGSGGTSAAVNVDTSGSIATTGASSQAIFAQSQGGLGGAGGWVAEGGLNAAVTDGKVGSVQVNLGGAGAAGGSAGAATVTNGASVTSGDFGATGIFAQSIGGDGGQGGAVYSGQANIKTGSTLNVAVNVGGSGGGGGTASAVSVSNTGDVTTAQSDSDAIFAQSVGGSGGKGGASYSVLLNLAAQSQSSQNFQVTVGGSGGSGATGGKVNVTSSAALSTAGASSAGIYAQSVGGNGGAGGAGGNILTNISGGGSSSDEKQTNVKVDIAVGGSGGTAAHSSSVDVVNKAGGAINTTGATSYGIFAQSVGGGGGDGGAASGFNLGFNGACSLSGANTFSYNCRNSKGGGSTTTYAANIDIGGKGGAGGNGAAVSVSNDGDVMTSGSYSHAIFAQSIGGGGGIGGGGSGGLNAFTSNKTVADIAEAIKKLSTLDPYTLLTSWTSFGLSIGGKGGAAGNGDDVTVANTKAISTSNTNSHGIFAQSVGGGGGTGGAGSSAPIHSLSIGGSGGGGGDGGMVAVTNASGSSIATKAYVSYGILAQSVGGGGGATGNRTSLVNGEGIAANIALRVGGSDGASGNGGTVTVQNTATTVSTAGRAAIGIFAQSIGGGGGLSTDGLDGATGTIVVTGSNSASLSTKGNGGGVNVVHDGSIVSGNTGTTRPSVASHGIVAQSVGGGGGYAGSVVMGPTANFGLQTPTGQGPSGTGGEVTVVATGNITTNGGSSVGIFAQSVGGGGGVTGNLDNDSNAGAIIGSAGGSGQSGVVSVTYGNQTKSMLRTAFDSVTAAGAHGIFAQSIGGIGTTTTTDTQVSVTVNQAISTPNAGSFGIYAQSGGDGMGAIDVTVNDTGSVAGGAKATIPGAEDGTAIFIKGGTVSTLTNSGTITAGQSGIAINATETSLKLNNTGTISGKILNKMSTVVVENQQGGVFKAGQLLEVDRFVNAGTLFVSGEGKTGETKLTGDLRQQRNGALVSDLELGSGISGDLLLIDGKAVLAGTVDVNLQGLSGPGEGANKRGSIEIVRTTGGLTQRDQLSVKPSAVARYQLEQPSDNSLHLRWDIDFANEDILSRTNHNQDELVGHIQALFLNGALADGATQEVAGLLEIETESDFAVAANSLSSEIYLNTQLSTFYSAQAFGQSLMSCSSRDGTYRFIRQTQCGWFDLGGSRFSQDSNSRSTGFDVDSYRLAGGVQFEVAPDFHVGGALAYVNSALGMDSASSEGNTLQFGVMAKKRFGAAMLAASVSGGYGKFDTSRSLATGTTVSGDQKIWNVSAMVRGAYTFEQKNWYVTPRIDLGVDHVKSGDVVENGSNPFGLNVSGGGNTFMWLRPAVEFGGEFVLANGSLMRPDVTLGLTQFIGSNDFANNARFAVTPSGVGSFTSEAQLDRSYLDISAGLKIITRSDITVDARAFGRLSENSETFGGLLQIEMRF